MLLNAAKRQGYNFYRFWVIKGEPTRGVKLPPSQIRVNERNYDTHTYTHTHIYIYIYIYTYNKHTYNIYMMLLDDAIFTKNI